MAEEYYEIPENPEYSEEIRKYQDTDPVHATQIVNPTISRIVENVAAVQRQLGKLNENTNTFVSEKGKPGGLATLDENGKVPTEQLPDEVEENLTAHLEDKDNPHGVTKEQLNLENVDNTSDKEKPISDKVQKALDELESRISSDGVPPGVIMLWHGSVATIPKGWTLCNGQNGAPNLLNKFVVCAGSAYNPGNTGGADFVTLTIDQMPAHDHVINAQKISVSVSNQYWAIGDTAKSNSIKIMNKTGGNQAHENRPPYYALCYIMKL